MHISIVSDFLSINVYVNLLFEDFTHPSIIFHLIYLLFPTIKLPPNPTPPLFPPNVTYVVLIIYT